MDMNRLSNRLPARIVSLWLLALGLAAPSVWGQSATFEPTIGPIQLSSQPEIDGGFHLLYELQFQEARRVFKSWEAQHPGEALGPAAEAASYLFEEFDRKGVLTSDFFLDDDRFLGGIEGKPDPQLRDEFNSAIEKSQEFARARLKTNPNDPDALFALTISTGMMADYSSMIERKQIESLKLTREADTVARNLLAVAPSAADGYVALGAANYIMGCLPVFKRFIIRFGGFHGDRAVGMRQLAQTASRGHYLRPFAKLTLGLAAMREKQWDLARTQFEQLTVEFPTNVKFARELAKVNGTIGPPTSRQ